MNRLERACYRIGGWWFRLGAWLYCRRRESVKVIPFRYSAQDVELLEWLRGDTEDAASGWKH